MNETSVFYNTYIGLIQIKDQTSKGTSFCLNLIQHMEYMVLDFVYLFHIFFDISMWMCHEAQPNYLNMRIFFSSNLPCSNC